LRSGELSEESIQRLVIQWVRIHPDIKNLVIHFANEGKRSPRCGKALKDIGLRPGVADLFIPMAKHGFHGLWIELKTLKGILSPVQKSFLEDMEQQGYCTHVCRSVDDTIKMIEWYCFD